MTIHTERLRLIALDKGELALLIEDLPRLEERLGVVYEAEPISGAFKGIIKGRLDKMDACGSDYLWLTFWLIVRKADNIVVGSADFKAPPDEAGGVEIGYGLAPEFEHMGFMTEAVNAMCEWALSSGAKRVLADTEPCNLASQSVLKRCGFEFLDARDGLEHFARETIQPIINAE